VNLNLLFFALMIACISILSGCKNRFAEEKQLFKQFIVERQQWNELSDRQGEFDPVPGSQKKLQIGIIESGVWTGFVYYFEAVIHGLSNHGWGKADVLDSLTSAEKRTILSMINALEKKGWSQNISFSPESYQLMSIKNRDETVRRVVSRNELDMIWGFGTWAGKGLRDLPDDFTTPCVIMAVSSPIKSGILDNTLDSGRNNITGRVDLNRFKRQIRFFHDMTGFLSLGVVYAGEDPTAALYSAIPDIHDVRKTGGKNSFNLILSTDVPASGDMKIINQKFIENVSLIIDDIDSFYLTLQNGINKETLPKLVKIFNDHKIPTFYMGGSDFVRKGVLLSFTNDYLSIGDFNSKKIIKIFKGAKPRDLELVFESSPRIAINLETAEIVGYEPPVDVLKIADEIFAKIEN